MNRDEIQQGRLESALARIAAEYLQEEASSDPLITVIGCTLSSDHKYAQVIVSVIPESKAPQAMAFLQRKESDLHYYTRTHIKTRIIPTFQFVLAGS